MKDEKGNKLLNYEGNWRDIFQNWEALALSYPESIESIFPQAAVPRLGTKFQRVEASLE